MDRLTSIIGPAPSELPRNDLLSKLRTERERVRKALELWSSSRGVRRKPPKLKGITPAGIKLIAKETGQTIEEVEKIFSDELQRRKELESNEATETIP